VAEFNPLPDQPLVSVIIANFNGRHLLPDCIAALRQQTHQRIEIVLADGHSKDGSVEYVRSEHPDVTVMLDDPAHGIGYDAALTWAARQSRGDNDAVCSPDMIARLVRRMQASPRLGVIAPKVLYFDKPQTVQIVGFQPDWYVFPHLIGFGDPDDGRWQGLLPFYPHGTALMLRKAMVDQLGAYDPAYLIMAEDLDLAWRAQLAGWDVAVDADAAVLHKDCAFTSHQTKPRLRWLSEKNIQRTILKNYAWHNLLWLLPLYAVLMVLEILYLTVTGRFGLAGADLRAIGWNLRMLPDTLRARREVQRLRVRRDREIMRWWIPGSLKLIALLEQTIPWARRWKFGKIVRGG
jgi:GT2 family glycosyltransferase